MTRILLIFTLLLLILVPLTAAARPSILCYSTYGQYQGGGCLISWQQVWCEDETGAWQVCETRVGQCGGDAPFVIADNCH